MLLQANVTDIAFKAQPLLTIPKKPTRTANTNNQAPSNKHYGKRTWKKPLAHEIEIGSSTSLTRTSRYCLRSPSVFAISTSATSHTRLDTPSSSSTIPLLASLACEVWYNLFHSWLDCPVLSRDVLAVFGPYMWRKHKRYMTEIDTSTYFVLILAFPRTDVSIKIDSSRPFQANAREFPSLQWISRLRRKTKIREIMGRNPRETYSWSALPSSHTQRAP